MAKFAPENARMIPIGGILIEMRNFIITIDTEVAQIVLLSVIIDAQHMTVIRILIVTIMV